MIEKPAGMSAAGFVSRCYVGDFGIWNWIFEIPARA